MRVWIVLALCGCGRFGFDPIAASDGAVPGVGFFLSPTGSDANPGTRAAPWLSFGYALPLLQPGDVLNLLPGDYDARGATGQLSLDCMLDPIANGTAAAPIVVRADRARTAHLYNAVSPLNISNCAYWEVDDLWLEGVDDAITTAGAVANVAFSSDIVLRGLLVQKPNRYANSNALEIGHSMRVLVEDTEAYDFFRGAFVTFESTAVTMRRDYANGRGEPDLAGGYVSQCAGGDVGFESYYAHGGIFEDMIVEGICDTGFVIDTGTSVTGDTMYGDFHKLVDDIALGPMPAGFRIVSECTSTSPCSTPDTIASNNTISNSVALQADEGFYLDGQRNVIDHVSALGSTATNAFSLGVTAPADPGLSATGSIIAALGDGTMNGVVESNQFAWGVDNSNMSATVAAYNPNDSHVMTSTAINPMLGGCDVYIPASSPMYNAGPSGTTIGADIRVQSLNGAYTTTPFWNADGSWAGCGAVVAGVNADPAASCIGVGARLHVGSGGCPVP